MLFTILTDMQVILRQGGVFKQVPLFARNGHVYAKYGSGFVGLLSSYNNGTTKPDVTWLPDSLSFKPTFTNLKMDVPE